MQKLEKKFTLSGVDDPEEFNDFFGGMNTYVRLCEINQINDLMQAVDGSKKNLLTGALMREEDAKPSSYIAKIDRTVDWTCDQMPDSFIKCTHHPIKKPKVRRKAFTGNLPGMVGLSLVRRSKEISKTDLNPTLMPPSENPLKFHNTS